MKKSTEHKMKPEELQALLAALKSDSRFLEVSESGINFHLVGVSYAGVSCWYAPQGEITHDITVIKPSSDYEIHVSWIEPRDKQSLLKAKTLRGVLGKIHRLG